MKKLVVLFLGVCILLTGCGANTAKNAVDSYLKKYKTLDSEVLVDLESTIEKENLSSSQSDVYRDILKKQYQDLSYEITEEEYDDDVSYITAKVEVYDLHRAQEDASNYLQNNPTEFNNDNGEYDVNKFLDYKLDKMKNTTERIEYTITFTVTKEDDKYVVAQPTENDLKKIHGVYNYDLD